MVPPMISNYFLCFYLLQVIGVIVLGMGIWLLADKASFIGLIKSVEHEQVQVSFSALIFNYF